MARLTLTAPVYGCVICCQIIYNLLKRHPVCKALIHKEGNGAFVCTDEAEKVREREREREGVLVRE